MATGIAMENGGCAIRARLVCFATCLFAVLAWASRLPAQTVEVPAFMVDSAGVFPDVAAAPDGSLAIVWVDSSTGDVNARLGNVRRYAADGSPLTPPVILPTSGFQGPTIAPLAGGGYAVAFLRYQAASINPVVGQRLDADAAPVGSAFTVESDGDGIHSAAVAGLPSGPVFAWDQGTIFARRFDENGLALESRRVVDDDEAGVFYQEQDVAVLPNGGYVVGWHNVQQHSSRLRIFRADGTPAGKYFAAGDFSLTHVAAFADGIAAVGYRTNEIYLQRFSLDGLPIGGPVLVYAAIGGFYSNVDVDLDPLGNALVVWKSYLSYTGTIQAGLVDVANHVGSPMTLYGYGSLPRVTHLSDGHFAAVWFGGGTRAAILSTCRVASPTCGDGVTNGPCEQCDQAAANSDTAPDACRTNCLAAGCGDGVVDSGEECDDGGRTGGDGCDQNCKVQVCGSGRIEGGEQCDDGGLVDDDGCDSNCTVTACGNGILTPGEECDDDNTRNADGCDSTCLVEECGNGRIEGDETCDDGDVIDGDGCDSNCTPSACGNGIAAGFEECDDGNFLDGDGCDRACLVEQCGNGRIEGGEPCDDGNATDGDGCNADCTLSPRLDPAIDRVRPLRLILGESDTAATGILSVILRNAHAQPQMYRLSAAPGTCPADSIEVGPDFDADLADIQDTVVLQPGQKARARLTVRIARSSFTGVDRAVPHRCTIQLVAGPAAPGSVDETPTNGVLSVAVDIVDRAAPHGAASEFFVKSSNGVRLTIPADRVAIERGLHLRARAVQPGAAFTFQLSDGDCPAGTVALEAQDPRGTATVRVRAARAFFTTPNALAPSRCSATVTAAGPGDTDPSNNATTLTIDVVDRNDL